MRKTLIIHVGMGKTGTSAIQSALRLNAQRLRGEGVHWCDLWLHPKTVGDAGFSSRQELFQLINARDPALQDRLLKIFGDNPTFGDAHTIVWSNEALATQWDALSDFIRDASAHWNTKIVIYFRNQIDWLISAYLQWAVKHKQTPGRIRTWEQYVHDARNLLDYPSIIDTWKARAAPSEMLARSYDAADDIVEDFFSVIGASAPAADGQSRVYETPGYASLALFKIFNDQFDEPMMPEPLLSLLEDAGVTGRDIHAVVPHPLDVADSDLDQLEATFSELNERLRTEYSVDLNATRKPVRLAPREHSDATNTDLIAALLMLTVHLNKKVTQLEARVRDAAPAKARDTVQRSN